MFNVSIELPAGGPRSRGYDRKTQADAMATFERVKSQARHWPGFVGTVVLSEDNRLLLADTIYVAR